MGSCRKMATLFLSCGGGDLAGFAYRVVIYVKLRISMISAAERKWGGGAGKKISPVLKRKNIPVSKGKLRGYK